MMQSQYISDYISALISLGYSTLARDKGQKNLDAYKRIEQGLIELKKYSTIDHEDIDKCIVVLKLLVDIRENLIVSDEILNNQIPNIYKAVDSMNELFIKSANKSIENKEKSKITHQCEAFLKVADEIRRDKKLKGLGILNGNLKNAIGRLRKTANIKSAFYNEYEESFELITNKSKERIVENDLTKIGESLSDLRKSFEKLENDDRVKSRLFIYIGKYEKRYIQKIKTRMNKLYKKNYQASLFDTHDYIDELISMEKLIKYHKNKGLNISIRQLTRRIQEEYVTPILQSLNEIKNFVIEEQQQPFWAEYENLYIKKYKENEIFSDSFYEYTLKGIPPSDTQSLLQEKIKKIKKLKIDELRYVSCEKRMETSLKKLIQFYNIKEKPGNAFQR